MKHDLESGQIEFDLDEWMMLGLNPDMPRVMPAAALHVMRRQVVEAGVELASRIVFARAADPSSVEGLVGDYSRLETIFNGLGSICAEARVACPNAPNAPVAPPPPQAAA